VRNVIYLLLAFYLFVNCRRLENNIQSPSKNTHVTDSLYNKANTFSKQYQLDSAYHYYHLILHQAKKNNDSFHIRYAHYNMARIDISRGFYNLGEFHAIRLMEYLAPSGEDEIIRGLVYNLFGNIEEERGNYGKAVSYFQKFRQIYRKQKDTFRYFLTYSNNMGRLEMARHNWEKAAGYFENILNADSLFEKHPVIYARALYNKALVMDKSGNELEAIPLAMKALAIREKYNHKPGMAGSYLFLAELWRDLGDTSKAVMYARKSLDLANMLSAVNIKIKALGFLIETDTLNRGNYFPVYARMRDSLWNMEIKSKDIALRTAYETAEKDRLLQEREFALKRQKFKFVTMLIFSLILLIFSIFVYFLYRKIKFQHDFIRHQKELIQNTYNVMHHTMENYLRKFLIDLRKIKNALTLEEVKAHVNYTASKVLSSIALHKEMKYEKLEGESHVDFKEMTEEIFKKLVHVYEKPQINLQVITSAPVRFKGEKRFVLGHIVHEFILNSFKHAFPDERNGKISFDLKENKTNYVLTMKNDGISFGSSGNSGAGLNQMRSLLMQMEGTSKIGDDRFQIINDGEGFTVIMRFSK